MPPLQRQQPGGACTDEVLESARASRSSSELEARRKCFMATSTTCVESDWPVIVDSSKSVAAGTPRCCPSQAVPRRGYVVAAFPPPTISDQM
mmetsp:Transcript_83714/g.194728  ORF Transcript_83714/g.194728 Transcript_83714/m.194728 type:complete len:92 (+) Transcript_83714:193-468(+)